MHEINFEYGLVSTKNILRFDKSIFKFGDRSLKQILGFHFIKDNMLQWYFLHIQIYIKKVVIRKKAIKVIFGIWDALYRK